MQIQIQTFPQNESQLRKLFDFFVILHENPVSIEYIIETDIREAIKAYKEVVNEYIKSGYKVVEIKAEEVNVTHLRKLIHEKFDGFVKFTEIIAASVDENDDVLIVLLKAELYAKVIDFSVFYGVGQPNHSVYELARFLSYYYGAGRILLASSPDVGDYYVSDELKICYLSGVETDEEAIKCYMIKRQQVPEIVYIHDGYEYAIIDATGLEKFDVKYVKLRKVGNSNVVAFPKELRRDYVRRVVISENLVLYDTL